MVEIRAQAELPGPVGVLQFLERRSVKPLEAIDQLVANVIVIGQPVGVNSAKLRPGIEPLVERTVRSDLVGKKSASA